MPEGKKAAVPAPKPVREEDLYSAKTHLHQPCLLYTSCHAIARVRNPSDSHERDFIKKQIGISAIINPEMAAAKEISHLLRFPGASKIDTLSLIHI